MDTGTYTQLAMRSALSQKHSDPRADVDRYHLLDTWAGMILR